MLQQNQLMLDLFNPSIFVCFVFEKHSKFGILRNLMSYYFHQFRYISNLNHVCVCDLVSPLFDKHYLFVLKNGEPIFRLKCKGRLREFLTATLRLSNGIINTMGAYYF